jgi:hypothetical protein
MDKQLRIGNTETSPREELSFISLFLFRIKSYVHTLLELNNFMLRMIRQNKSNGVAPLQAAYETAVLLLH